MFEMQNEILSVEELMELLYIGRNCAYKLLNSKKIKAFKIGRTWKIPRMSLENYIINNCKLKDNFS